MTRAARYMSILLPMVSALAGCTVATEEGLADEHLETTESELHLAWPKWPNGTVPVCWTTASTQRANFAAESTDVKERLNTSWPYYANVEFTGWGTCPSDPGNTVRIELGDASRPGGCRSHGTPGYAPGDLDMLLCTDSGSWTRGLMPHEFGHVLGFSHEMARPDFSDDGSGACTEANIEGGDYLGTPANDRTTIMGATGYCNNNTLLTRWDISGARKAYGPSKVDNVLNDGETLSLYARKLSTGDIYKRSGSSWTKIGGPGGQFILVRTTLYGLSPDGSGVYKYSGSGTSWTKVGGAARVLLQCGASGLCATNPDNNDIYSYSGSGWSRIGAGGAMFASTTSTLYRLSNDRQTVSQYDGTGTKWTTVGGAASAIFATTSSLYATNPTTGNIYKYGGTATGWSRVGGPGRFFVGVGETLYGLSPDRSGVYRYSGSGTSWTKVGGPANWIYGGGVGGASLYATNPSTKDIYKYSGSGTSWTKIGQP